MRDKTFRNYLIGCAVCGLASIVLCMFSVSMWYRPPAGQEAPKVTDWMQAWGGIGGILAGFAAAGAAAWLVHFERQEARAARDELAADREARALAAARSVAGSKAQLFHEPGRPNVVYWYDFSVNNGGTTTILEVRVVVIAPGIEAGIAGSAPLIAAGGEYRPKPPSWFAARQRKGVQSRWGDVDIYFRDPENRAWLVRGAGEVQRCPYPYPFYGVFRPEPDP
ncbi:hypothetical protein [Solwaraspora sp. WMMA2101]|uniref:hypothetical protein n=1 Tax=Solwaraspora sp. WMMA2101 TaxID=3404124 RepID=UPI003B92664C